MFSWPKSIKAFIFGDLSWEVKSSLPSSGCKQPRFTGRVSLDRPFTGFTMEKKIILKNKSALDLWFCCPSSQLPVLSVKEMFLLWGKMPLWQVTSCHLEAWLFPKYLAEKKGKSKWCCISLNFLISYSDFCILISKQRLQYKALDVDLKNASMSRVESFKVVSHLSEVGTTVTE